MPHVFASHASALYLSFKVKQWHLKSSEFIVSCCKFIGADNSGKVQIILFRLIVFKFVLLLFGMIV